MSNFEPETLKRPIIKPAMFIDNRVVERHSIFLGHFFTALADQSYRAALVCEHNCEDDVVLSPAVEMIVHTPTRVPFLAGLGRRYLVEQLEKFGPNLLHCMSQTKARLTRLVAEEMNTKYVLTVYSLERFAKDEILHELCAGLISPSDTITESIKSQFPSMSQRIWQINIGVFVENRTACFTNLNRMPGLVVAHPFEKIEHFEPLFEAARHLLIDGYEFMLVLIGGGRAESQMRQLVKSMGLVHVVNFVSETVPHRNIFVDADIFIQPVAATMFNASILEAMSVGVVVAGASGGVDDMLIENETAVLFDQKSPESIYATLKMLLDRRDYAQYVARSAQAFLKRNHSVTGMMDDLIETYKLALQANAK